MEEEGSVHISCIVGVVVAVLCSLFCRDFFFRSAEGGRQVYCIIAGLGLGKGCSFAFVMFIVVVLPKGVDG